MSRRILIVEDDMFSNVDEYLRLKGFTTFLARDYETALRLVETHQPDVMVVDIKLPRQMDQFDQKEPLGVELALQVKAAYPHIGVVIHSAYPEHGGRVVEYVNNRGRGIAYKLKGCMPAELLQAIANVMRGQVDISAEVGNLPQMLIDSFLQALTPAGQQVIASALRSVPELAPREMEVFELIGQGLSTDYVAGRLVIEKKTVYGHIERIYRKLGLHRLRQEAYLSQPATVAIVCLLWHMSGGNYV